MVEQELKRRGLPNLFEFQDGTPVNRENWSQRRLELQRLLCSETYGFLPPAPRKMKATLLSSDKGFCAGKATLSKVMLEFELEQGEFSFPIYTVLPNSSHPCPAFVHINFRDNVPDCYMPSEEICDNGFATISFCYKDVTSDDADFSSGLAGVLGLNQNRALHSPGKIALWAWAAMRVMDYIQSLPSIDHQNVAVVGHSRLGKTALLTGAFDERFSFVISNDSGCNGAAISRGKSGETIKRIYQTFPYWFCKNHQQYADHESALPYDQHALLALVAPRLLCVGSAAQDTNADPISEFLCCVAASDAYQLLGVPGLICSDRLPVPGDHFHCGRIGYHLRSGRHYFSRYDWQQYMNFFRTQEFNRTFMA